MFEFKHLLHRHCCSFMLWMIQEDKCVLLCRHLSQSDMLRLSFLRHISLLVAAVGHCFRKGTVTQYCYTVQYQVERSGHGRRRVFTCC
jgi:hypothetical protein